MRARGTLLVIVLAGVLVACGGDDEGDEDLDLGGSETEESEETPDPVPTPTEEPTEEPTDEPSEEPTEESETYEVQSGDTLSGIASQLDTTVEALIEANDLDDPDLLGVGDELVIP